MADRSGTIWKTTKNPYHPSPLFAIPASRRQVVKLVRSLQLVLIAVAKAKPGSLNFASSGTGGSPHLAGEMFKQMAGVEMVHVPYKGTAPELNDLLAGNVTIAFETTPALLPHVKEGRLIALAVN